MFTRGDSPRSSEGFFRGLKGVGKAVSVLLKELKPEAVGLWRSPPISYACRLFKCWDVVRLTVRLKTQVCKKCYLYINFNLTLSLQGVSHNCYFGGSPFHRGLQMSWHLDQPIVVSS